MFEVTVRQSGKIVEKKVVDEPDPLSAINVVESGYEPIAQLLGKDKCGNVARVVWYGVTFVARRLHE